MFPKPLYTDEDSDLVAISSNLVGELDRNDVDGIGQISETECFPTYNSAITETRKGARSREREKSQSPFNEYRKNKKSNYKRRSPAYVKPFVMRKQSTKPIIKTTHAYMPQK